MAESKTDEKKAAGQEKYFSSIVSCIRQCTRFSGSATRAEFIRFLIFALASNAAMWGIAVGIRKMENEEDLYYLNQLDDSALYYAILGLWAGWLLVSLSALCAVSVRRIRTIRQYTNER